MLAARAPEVAPRLLGWTLTTEIDGAVTTVVITEVEAYTADDPASHAYRGPTARNASMYGPPGTLYVYRSYGIHWCMNVTTSPAGEASAVLLRGGVLTAGQAIAIGRRGRSDRLCDGPGKLTQALGVTGAHDGVDVLDPAGPVRLAPGPALPATATPRIGITRAVEVPWRWIATRPVLSPLADPETDAQH